MTRDEIKKLAILQSHYLRNIEIPVKETLTPDEGRIGFCIIYHKRKLWYFYDENGVVKIPDDDLFDIRVKLISELPDDNIQQSIEKAQRKHIEKLLFGNGKKQKSALGSAKLMYEIFGDDANNLAERMLTTEEYLKFLKWKTDTKNLDF